MENNFLEIIINLLNTTEKRYISEHLAMRNNSNHFSLLFNSFIARKTDPLIEEKKSKNPNAYYVNKGKLSKKIFKLLRMYHSDTSRELAMKNICIDIEILYNKGAFEYSRKLINKALEVCEKCEWFELEHYLLSWQEKILLAILKIDTLQNDLQTITERKKILRSKLTNLEKHALFFYQILIIKEKIGIPSKSSEFAMINKAFESYNQSRIEKNSFRAKIYHYQIYAYYFSSLQDYHKFYFYAQKQVKTVEAFQISAGITLPEDLSNALLNQIICEVYLKKYTDLKNSLQKIRTINYISKRDEASVFIQTHIVETYMLVRLGQFRQIQNKFPIINKGLIQYGHLITNERKSVLYFNVSYLFFGYADYRQALKWVHKILNNPAGSIREDLFYYARILNLIIHFELGNNEILESLLLSTYRYLYKRNKLFEIENLIMHFIKQQYTHYVSPVELKKSLALLLSQIKKITTKKTEKVALEYFDFISWLESKIENRPFAEIVKEKINTK